MSFKFYKKTLLVVLVLYFALGMLSETSFNKSGEHYPVFSWALFGKVPNERHKFTVKIYKIGDEQFTNGIPFKDGKGYFSTINQSPSGYEQMIQVMGSAFVGDDHEKFEETRNMFEMNFIKYPVEYELVRHTFDPIPYFRSGTIKSEESLGFYSVLEQ